MDNTKRRRKLNNKGFSLVELIIVIAIMIALVALVTPQYIKYVQSSRDSVVETAAQEIMTIAKAEYTIGSLTVTDDDDVGEITVSVANGDGAITIAFSGVKYGSGSEGDSSGEQAFSDLCGVSSQTTKSDKSFVITIDQSGDLPSFDMTEGTVSGD